MHSTTEPGIFDPFADRLARDIRNSLSTAMAAAFTHADPKRFTDRCDGWLARDLPAANRRYIESRRRVFEDLFAAHRTHRLDAPLLLAVRLWNAGLFFEVHEVVENQWHAATGKRRQALKGLVQAAGTYVHRQAGRTAASARLGPKAAATLRAAAEALDEIANIRELVACLERGAPAAPRLVYGDRR